MANTSSGKEVILLDFHTNNDTGFVEIVPVDCGCTGSFVQINMENGTLILEFSETIDFVTFSPEQISLQSIFDPPLDRFNITDANSTQLSLTTIEVELSMSDLADLKRELTVCTSRGNCYIFATQELIMDTAGNSFSAIPLVSPGVIVQEFIRDDLNPVLVSFDLDLDSNQLLLEFDEPIDVDSLNPTGITIHDAEMPINSFELTNGVVYSIDAVTADI